MQSINNSDVLELPSLAVLACAEHHMRTDRSVGYTSVRCHVCLLDSNAFFCNNQCLHLQHISRCGFRTTLINNSEICASKRANKGIIIRALKLWSVVWNYPTIIPPPWPIQNVVEKKNDKVRRYHIMKSEYVDQWSQFLALRCHIYFPSCIERLFHKHDWTKRLHDLRCSLLI